jgi:hypothetical protein
MRKTAPRGKRAIAAAIDGLAASHRQHVLAVRKLARVMAVVANEIAAASAAQTAELTALRHAVEGGDEPRRIGRRA